MKLFQSDITKDFNLSEHTILDISLFNSTQQQNLQQKPQEIKIIKNGSLHIVILTKNNEIFVYGRNDEGQIGLNNLNEINKFVKIKNTNFGIIKYLECNHYYTIILNNLNQFYFTGTFSCFKFKVFTKLFNFTKIIKKIRCGTNHLFILTNENTIYGLGSNDYGQLGLPESIKNCKTFTKINDMKVKDIQCGNLHSILLDVNNDIYATGYNYFGELGLVDNISRNSFTKINFQINNKIIKIFANYGNSFILTDNYNLYGTGYNSGGQLGVGDLGNKFEFTKINLQNINNNEKNKIEICKSSNFKRYFKINNNIYVSGNGNNLKFTKLKYNQVYNYIYIFPLILNDYILLSDYKINVENEENNMNLLQRLQNNQFCDVDFIVNSSILLSPKKRNRNIYENNSQMTF